VCLNALLSIPVLRAVKVIKGCGVIQGDGIDIEVMKKVGGCDPMAPWSFMAAACLPPSNDASRSRFPIVPQHDAWAVPGSLPSDLWTMLLP
jgi:hypothetical protein